MKFTLLTYESILAHNAGYAHSYNASEFLQRLEKLITNFSTHSGINKENIYWQEVNDSDWCDKMIIIYAKVDSEWKPTNQTTCIDVSYSPNWYSHLASSLSTWIQGKGKYVNINDNPAQNPHSLYRTEVIS